MALPVRLIAYVAFVLLHLGIDHQVAGAAQRPNIVLILVDDLGWSDFGCYGSEVPTPNIDALAAGGVRFTQFYNTARCSPTRASLISGLYPHQAGLGHLDSVVQGRCVINRTRG